MLTIYLLFKAVCGIMLLRNFSAVVLFNTLVLHCGSLVELSYVSIHGR